MDHMKTTDITPSRARPLRQILVRVSSVVLVLATLTALFYAVENWRGSRAWTSTLEDLRSRGEKIALEDFERAPVPDERNAAMHPALRCFTYTLPGGKRAMRLKTDPPDVADAAMVAKWKAFLAWRLVSPDPFTKLYDVLDEENRDLAPAQAAARELTPALAEHMELMNAVEEALKRPFCQWPPLAVSTKTDVSVRGDFFETIGMSMMEAGRFFHVRKICEAIPAGALSAWDEGVGLNRFAQSAASQKTIGNFLLAAAISGQQEGLVINLLEFTQPDPERCFKAEAELAVQPYLSGIIGDYLKGERAFLIAAISSVLAQEDPSDLSRIMSGQAPAKGWARVEQVVRRYGPAGWLKQNLANTVRGTGELIGAFDPAMKPEDQRQREAQVIAVSKSKGALFHWMERDTIGIYGGLYEPVIQTDTRRNLLRAALLIAAHRSGTGVAPMSLDELPAELRSRIPVSPWNGDMPRIKRDEHGVWTLAYGGIEERKTGEPEFSVRIRSW